jgi:hypothetical protein
LRRNFRRNATVDAMLVSHTQQDGKPQLVILHHDLTLTARRLADIIAASGLAFNRAGPVQVFTQDDGPPRIIRLTPDGTTILAHELCRPVLLNSDGNPTAKTLSPRVASLYLALPEWGLRPLKGITSAPILSDNGIISLAQGYDDASGFWCAAPPEILVPERPGIADARQALALIRWHFRTFPFADAAFLELEGLTCVDATTAPGQDETAFPVGLLTAVCRPSLPLAPGILIAAPLISGAGTGKGNLVRAITQIAFGFEPRAFTAGGDSVELDKRIASALIEATPVLFLDNVNGEALRSDLLASVLTERRVDVRPLGSSRMLPLCPSAFVAITGNGLGVSEDLARRFVVMNLDAGTEDPEARRFPPGFLASTAARRSELLAAALTIWRWGRQNYGSLRQGRPLGSFEEWSQWVRDPLLTLGCADPVERQRMLKANDPIRRMVAEIFAEWWQAHGAKPVTAANLDEGVIALIDPQGRGRQWVASWLSHHTGTTAGGFVLTVQKPTGRWGAATYAVSGPHASGRERV